MYVLPFDKQVAVISHLVRGNSIRKTAELTRVHRDTVMRLLRTIGDSCAQLHDHLVRNLESPIIEVDELWSFIRKKKGRLIAGDPHDWGDQYTFVALDAVSKLVISYHVGKRQSSEAERFANDIYSRLLVRPQITSDGWKPYIEAFEKTFGANMDYTMMVKMIDVLDQLSSTQGPAGHGFSQLQVNQAVRTIIAGTPNPSYVTTAHVERQNLTIRMDCQRFARKTLAHSKSLANHKAAVALHFAYYNFCRIHDSIRVTPAMQVGLTDQAWTVADLIQQAKEAESRASAARLAETVVVSTEEEVLPIQVEDIVRVEPTMVWKIPPI